MQFHWHSFRSIKQTNWKVNGSSMYCVTRRELSDAKWASQVQSGNNLAVGLVLESSQLTYYHCWADKYHMDNPLLARKTTCPETIFTPYRSCDSSPGYCFTRSAVSCVSAVAVVVTCVARSSLVCRLSSPQLPPIVCLFIPVLIFPPYPTCSFSSTMSSHIIGLWKLLYIHWAAAVYVIAEGSLHPL